MFRTWADVMEQKRAGSEVGTAAMAAAGEVPPLPPPRAAPVDRGAGEGPPPCCRVRIVPADMLVWYGGISPEALERVRARLPQVADVPAEDLYLCHSCRAILRRGRVLHPEEMPRSRPLHE